MTPKKIRHTVEHGYSLLLGHRNDAVEFGGMSENEEKLEERERERQERQNISVLCFNSHPTQCHCRVSIDSLVSIFFPYVPSNALCVSLSPSLILQHFSLFLLGSIVWNSIHF